MYSLYFFVICLILVASTGGSPVDLSSDISLSTASSDSFQGSATWFYPDTGACGESNTVDDFIVAMNYPQYGSGEPCYKTVKITNKSNGNVIKAKVTDLCPGCGYGSLDLTPSAFKALGDLDAGVLPIAWEWA
ncbi:Non-catalytic module family EXPN [Melampsora americana]|nr:Non-catalytic module family EXPN [Melampsora americana]